MNTKAKFRPTLSLADIQHIADVLRQQYDADSYRIGGYLASIISAANNEERTPAYVSSFSVRSNSKATPYELCYNMMIAGEQLTPIQEYAAFNHAMALADLTEEQEARFNEIVEDYWDKPMTMETVFPRETCNPSANNKTSNKLSDDENSV